MQLFHTDNDVCDYASAIKKLDELATKKQREMDYVMQMSLLLKQRSEIDQQLAEMNKNSNILMESDSDTARDTERSEERSEEQNGQHVAEVNDASNGIRIGADFQAEIPLLRHVTVTERGDKRISQEAIYEELHGGAKNGRKVSPTCATPDCYFRDGHIGAHSSELVCGKRRQRSTTLQVSHEKNTTSPKGCEKQPRVELPIYKHKKSKRVLKMMIIGENGKSTYNGSVGKVVPMDERRKILVEGWKRKHGAAFGSDKGGRDAVVDELKTILIVAGKCEGSMGPSGNCRCDGVVYNYAKFLGWSFDAGIFTSREDLFREDAQSNATDFYQDVALRNASTTRAYKSMESAASKAQCVQKYFNNYMLGFRWFVGDVTP